MRFHFYLNFYGSVSSVRMGWGGGCRGRCKVGRKQSLRRLKHRRVVKLTEYCQFYTLVHFNPCSNSLEDGMTSFSLQMERTSFFLYK